jgi:perosamine synthetase
MDEIFMAGPSVTEADIEIVNQALRDWYKEPYWFCEAFQDEFAAYHDRKYGIMTPNCTTSLHLVMAALGIGPGDEVVVPECTWIATTAPVVYQGATPIFADIHPETWCLDPDSLRRSITDRTKAFIVVELYGNMPPMDEFEAISEEFGIPMIEDAAEALGSVYNCKKAGKFGVSSHFSFHRTKTLTTGEGGMVIIDDEELYERCMFLRDHGRKADGVMYHNYEVTFKYMPSNVQAALGYAQFKRVDELIGKKRWIYNLYREKLSDLADIQLNPEPEGVINGAWITGLVFGKSHNMTKLKAMAEMEKLGLPTRPFFYPLSSLPAFAGQRKRFEPLNPIAYDLSERGINLPGALNLTEAQVDRVCDAIRQILGT